jgi:ABC-type transport system involved in multi-copper enzyme maturation permease subunit
MNASLVITRLTFLESVRRRIALAAFILGIVFLLLYGIGFHYIYKSIAVTKAQPGGTLVRTQIFNFLSTAGLYAVNFLTIAMGALISADTLAGEITSGTIQTIASKPIRRRQIVFGKWLGFVVLLGMYLMLMAGGVLLIIYLQSGYHVRHIGTGIPLIYLSSIILMTVSMACSSTFSALATGGIVFGLYGLGFIGGWLEQIGAVLKNQTAVNIGIASSLIIPTEALWKRAAYEITSPIVRSLGVAAGPFAAVSVPNPLMILYAILYTVLMLFLAVRRFSKRDL